MVRRPDDLRWMRRALALARRAVPGSSPNPAVGAVLVRAGRAVGEGFTAPPPGPHAEVRALARAGRSARGATLYTTLEPCCHVGRTGPCTAPILEAGVRRVVSSLRDPSDRVRGRGFARLRRGGVEVEVGLLEGPARLLNQPFFKLAARGLPYVTLKVAATLDGRIATALGESRWITGGAAREEAMRLRAASDAILVGVGTVLADDPALTSRDPSGRPRARQPLRVILDTRARTPGGARSCDHRARTLVAVTRAAPTVRRRALASHGVEVVEFPARGGRVALASLLSHLSERGVSRLLVEGGSAVAGAFVRERLADALAYFVAPRILGATAVAAFGLPSPRRLTGAARVRIQEAAYLGGDWLFRGLFREY